MGRRVGNEKGREKLKDETGVRRGCGRSERGEIGRQKGKRLRLGKEWVGKAKDLR